MDKLQKALKKLMSLIAKAIAAEVLKPIQEIKETQREQSLEIKAIRQEQEKIRQEQSEKIEALSARVEKLHQSDPVIEECDLASLDNQICTLISKCRDKGYTTADERRRGTRMHEAYQARGGNHGEEHEYKDVFCHLPTEEEYFRMIGG